MKYWCNIAEFLEKTNEKLEIGKDIEAVDDLCRAIEHFLVDLLKILKESPKDLHKVENNIQLLKERGYINFEMEGVIKSILYNKTYIILKDHSHKGKSFDLLDLRYFYQNTEQSINYLLEKIWIYKINGNQQTNLSDSKNEGNAINE